jgi:two-component system heavy metal sensor histidine kinase CusS
MFGKFSLTTRLTLFFTALSSAVILGLSILFIVSTGRHFVDLDSSALDDKKHLIEDILVSSKTVSEAQTRLNEALDHHHGLYVLVRSSQGEIFYQTAGYSEPAEQHSRIKTKGEHEMQTWSIAGQDFRATSFEARMAQGTADILKVDIAVNTDHHKQFLKDIQQSVLAYAVLATLVTGLLAWFAAHQGMSPLRAMRRRAAAVTGQRLQQERMPVDAVPIEMADLARELNQMLDRLQDDFKRLSDFSADLAHELRTPISNLLTQTQVTLSTKRDLITYQDTLASNAEELQRLARMVSDMLFLAKTERGVDLPHKEFFAAEQEAGELLDFYEIVAEEKSISMSTDGEANIFGDRLMFRRAVSNLLSNALRHTHNGGVIGIRIASKPEGIEVLVENTGDAISPSVMARIFDRFYRADPARLNPGEDGVGLGLSITKAIVDAHGGSVSVTSEHGCNKFLLMFPPPHTQRLNSAATPNQSL